MPGAPRRNRVELSWAAGCVAAAVCIGGAGAARAEPSLAVASAAAVDPAPPSEAPILLATRGDALDVARLSALLGAELGRGIVLEQEPRHGSVQGVVTVTYRRGAGELAVTWEHDGKTLTRLVAAPPDGVVEADAAMLAGNLAREQVDELLAKAPVLGSLAAATTPVEPLPEAVPPEHWIATVGVFYPFATHYGHAEVTSTST